MLEVQKGKSFIMQTQNTFDRDNILEVLSFNGNVIEVPAEQKRSFNNMPVERSKPSHILRFAWPKVSDITNSEIKFSSIEPLNVVRFKSQL